MEDVKEHCVRCWLDVPLPIVSILVLMEDVKEHDDEYYYIKHLYEFQSLF